MRRLNKLLTSQKQKRNDMANGNNGNNGSRGFLQIAQLASTGILILTMFGLWWQTADPRARLDKIEHSQTDNRKELNEAITGLRKETGERYVSQREHNDLQNRLESEIKVLQVRDVDLLTKAQFEAWKNERDQYIKTMKDDIEKAFRLLMPRGECEVRWIAQEKVNQETTMRLDRLRNTLDKASENFVSKPTADEVWKLTQARMDKLYMLYEQLLNQMNKHEQRQSNR